MRNCPYTSLALLPYIKPHHCSEVLFIDDSPSKWWIPFCLFLAAIFPPQISFLTRCLGKSTKFPGTAVQPEPSLCKARPDVFGVQAIVWYILTETNNSRSWSGYTVVRSHLLNCRIEWEIDPQILGVVGSKDGLYLRSPKRCCYL